MNFFCIFVCLFGLSVAQETCCMNNQWEGLISVAGGNVDTTNNISTPWVALANMSYDKLNERLFQRTTLGEYYQEALYDFNSQYFYVRENDGPCVKGRLSNITLFEMCVPLDSIVVTTGNLGSNVPAGLYAYGIDNELFTGVANALWKTSECTMLIQVLAGTPTAAPFIRQAQQQSYINITDGIKDEGVFDPPAECPEMVDPFLRPDNHFPLWYTLTGSPKKQY